MAKKRRSWQVSPEFDDKMHELKKKINAIIKGKKEVSLRDITEQLARNFDAVEDTILKQNGNSIDINIRMERRDKK